MLNGVRTARKRESPVQEGAGTIAMTDALVEWADWI
jgi:hypothetical protein